MSNASFVNKCWDGALKIGVVPEDECRSMYINLTPTSFCLALLIWAMFDVYIRMAFGLLQRLFLALNRPGATRKLAVWTMWSATSAFPVFYSAYVLFLYINDDWWQLYHVQLFFTTTQFIQAYATLFMLNEAIERNILLIIAPVIVGITAMKLGFNVLVEVGGNVLVEKMDTKAFARNMVLMLGDVGVLAVWIAHCRDQDGHPVVSRSMFRRQIVPGIAIIVILALSFFSYSRDARLT